MSHVKPEVTPVSTTPAMTKEQEVRFRERATTVKDRVAEMMRAMFSTIDAVRKERDTALDALDGALPNCGWADCKDKATRKEKDATTYLCDRHTNGRPMEDCRWAPLLRALMVAQGRSAKESAPGEPAVAKW